ncbi:UNVERIFIED_CONTAM: B-box zinc finger protein 21 [Sesamum radiatum]|uniref:B-box zinc finger protein 21 n=1 Tax=Sesamum radiatum TaxID=300843 RepID=A0AAW2QER5_SESRA
MKIQCDVCEKDEASLFCVADEAALCTACDHRVHHANKLAGKHQRFSLHHPHLNKPPSATSARECDVPIHKANEHTQKHARFLLTGVKLSATAALYSASQSSAESASSTLTNNNVSDAGSHFKSQEPKNKAAPMVLQRVHLLLQRVQQNKAHKRQEDKNPRWHVEDFLDSSSDPSPSPSPYGVCKSGESDLLQIWDADLVSSNMSGFSTEKVGSWVPQMHQTQINQSYQSTEMMGFGTTNGFRQQSKEFTANNVKPTRKRNEDNSFAVPQIRPSSAASKRSRTLWFGPFCDHRVASLDVVRQDRRGS